MEEIEVSSTIQGTIAGKYKEKIQKLKDDNNKLIDVINGQDVKIADLETSLQALDRAEKKIVELEKERNDFKGRLHKAESLLQQWYQIGKKNSAPHCYGFVKDTEQFLKENK